MKIFFLIGATLWAVALIVGATLISGVYAQQVDGYPNQQQLILYIFVPVGMLILNIAFLLVRKNVPNWINTIVTAGFLVPMFLYTFFFTGGV